MRLGHWLSKQNFLWPRDNQLEKTSRSSASSQLNGGADYFVYSEATFGTMRPSGGMLSSWVLNWLSSAKVHRLQPERFCVVPGRPYGLSMNANFCA